MPPNPKHGDKLKKAQRGRKPPTMTLSYAAGRYGYQRHWLQKLLIDGRLEGYKNDFGHWRVTVRAMEALVKARREREMGWTPAHELESKTA